MTTKTSPNGQAAGSYAPRATTATETHNDRKLRSDPLLYDPGRAARDPQLVATRLWIEYTHDPTISRNVNQVVEQATGDGHVRPSVGNDAINEALIIWWKQQRMDLRLRPGFKQFCLSGEKWHYVPILRGARGARVPLRDLTPWMVREITGWHWTDWQSALYRNDRRGDGGSDLELTPDNTSFFAHDALFESLRGLPPFATMLFAAKRYRRFLDARERINRLAGTVTGELKFETIADAAAVLGWPTDDQGNITPQTVYLPEEGTLAVLIGDSSFDLKVPNVNAGAADPDAQRFYLQLIEGGRLPEYASGNGANVNVATATVQNPLAVRFILSLRDEFEYAMTETVRLVLRRLATLGFIPEQWTATRGDDTTEVETPETAMVAWSFPEIRELDFQAHFDAIMKLVEKALLKDEKAMELLGYDPEEDMPDPEERQQRRQAGFNLATQLGNGNPEEGVEVMQQAFRATLMRMLGSDAPPE